MSNTSWSTIATNDSVYIISIYIYIYIYIYMSLSLLCTVQEVLAQRERETREREGERERFDDKAGMHFYNEKKDKKRSWILNYQVEKLLL